MYLATEYVHEEVVSKLATVSHTHNSQGSKSLLIDIVRWCASLKLKDDE